MRQERRRADAAHKRQNEVHKNHSEGRAEVGEWAESKIPFRIQLHHCRRIVPILAALCTRIYLHNR